MTFRICPKLTLCLSHLLFAVALCLLVITGTLRHARAQSMERPRQYGRMMLDMIKSDIKKNYYDAQFHGIDIEVRFKAAAERIKTAPNHGQINAIIAQTLVDFNDSHTYFLPDGGFLDVEHGWRMQIIGDKCFVTAVKPGSDAEAKGLKVGDQVWSVNGYEPTRENLWKIQYYYFSLNPRPGMRVIVERPNGQQQFDVRAKVKLDKEGIIKYSRIYDDDDVFQIEASEKKERLRRHKIVELSKDAVVWKVPEFDLTEGEVADKMDKVKKYQSLILDMRGNSGGAEVTLVKLLSYFFDHDVKIGDMKRRKEMKPLVVKKRSNNLFSGKLIVLIDSESGSAAELFARVVQLEKRGEVLGDRSAGAVMRSQLYYHEAGLDQVLTFAVSITDADIIMTDGKSLEHTGVVPNELLLPASADMAATRDIVLARAAALVGIELTAEKAGTFFPVEWKK